MSNKLSVSRMLLLGSAFASVALIVAGMGLETKPAWMDLATPLAIVVALWMLWVEARKFSFDPVDTENPSAATDVNTQSKNTAIVHLTSDQIRVFGSLEDGKRHGWSFQDEIGRLGSTTLYLWAEFQGQKWKYDGKNTEGNNAIVPDDIRVFGDIRYTACAPVAESVANKNIVVEKSTAASAPLHPALNNTP